MRTKVLTNQCKSCTKNVIDPDNEKQRVCVWGKGKKLLLKQKGKKKLDCKLIVR